MIKVCEECNKKTVHYAKGLCESCYKKKRYRENIKVRNYYKLKTYQWRKDNLLHWRALNRKAVKKYYDKKRSKKQVLKRYKV